MKHTPHYNANFSNDTDLLFIQDLTHLRAIENFNPSSYVYAKSSLLVDYFQRFGIDSVLIAVSGGIDSACVLALLKHIQFTYPTVLKSVTAVTLPAISSPGVSNQKHTLQKIEMLESLFGTIHIMPMDTIVENSMLSLEHATGHRSSPWAEGQEIPYLRTAWLYGITANLSDLGLKTVVVGTTNKDEGAYLGYFGKASDGLVDIQPISDLHKHQVVLVAQFLKVPASICEAIPNGDMHDGRVDTEVFGASYNEVEWAIRMMEISGCNNASDAFDYWIRRSDNTPESHLKLQDSMSNIDSLHHYNSHKYIGCSPAVHFDLIPSRITNGWRTNCNLTPLNTPSFSSKSLVNYQDIKIPKEFFIKPSINPTMRRLDKGIVAFTNALSSDQVHALSSSIQHGQWQRSNINGKASNIHSTCGSWRKTTHDTLATDFIYELLGVSGLPLHYHDIGISSDCANDSLVWTRTCMNSAWRWISYEPGDLLVPHYDDTYQYTSHKKTLLSAIIYLTAGTTRFMHDFRINHEYADFTTTFSGQPYLEFNASPGDILIFDHRLLHDSPRVSSNKLIIRTDIVYEKPNLGGALIGY